MSNLRRPNWVIPSTIIALILFFSGITVANTFIVGLNSDVIIHSMISLVDVTKFYWGQERLLNVLPALFSPVKDPGLNLYLILLTTAISHFVLLFILSATAVSLWGGKPLSWASASVFIVLSGVFLLTFTNYPAFEVAVYHYEWPLAIDLAVLAVWCYTAVKRLWLRIPLVFIITFVAIGVNFSIALIFAGLVTFLLISRHFTWRDGVVWLLMGATVELFWVIDSNDLRSNTFKNFKWESFSGLIVKTMNNLFLATDGVRLFAAITLIFGIGVLTYLLRGSRLKDLSSTGAPLRLLVILFGSGFCATWLLFFAQNDWVVINSNHFRYFLPLVYFAMFLLAMVVALIVLSWTASWGLAVVLAAIFVAATWQLGWLKFSTDFNQANVVKQSAASSNPQAGYAAGDFWLSWPFVYSQLINNREGVGLALRSEQTRAITSANIANDLTAYGFILVNCYGKDTVKCVDQVMWHAQQELQVEPVSDTGESTMLRFTKP